MFKVKRDTSDASEAKASLDDMKSLFILPHYEVQAIAKVDASNQQAALAWVWTLMDSGRTPTEESLAHLDPHLPALSRSADVRELADVLSEFGGKAGRYHPKYAIDVALRADRQAEPQSALKLLESALMNPHIEAGDRETVLYQLAMVHESWFQNYGAAANLYQQVMNEFPGSPLAD